MAWTTPDPSPMITADIRSDQATVSSAASKVRQAGGVSLERSHSRSVRSPDTDSARRPSASTATPSTGPLRLFHSTAAASYWDPDSARRPSASTAKLVTWPSCLPKRSSSAPYSKFHSRSVPSQDPASARRLSASTATVATPPIPPEAE